MTPWLVFALLILGLPTLELYVLITVGAEIGAVPAVFLVVFTAVLGALLVRQQGVSTLNRVRQALARDETPAFELLQGAILLAGGLLLLIPGFLTDALGFLCLIPRVRRYLVLLLFRRARATAANDDAYRSAAPDRRVIEGEFRREND
jgi:UPF0716 protein FxsA